MSSRNKTTGKAPAHRENLRGKQKKVTLRMRTSTYQALVSMLGDGDSYDTVVERLIVEAKPARRLCV